MQEHVLIEKGVSLFYRTIGEGYPVVLVHGFAEDGNIWDGLAKDLSHENRLIIPDLPGSGKSTGDIDGCSMESLAEYLAMIMEKEKVDECIMVGHSMGGYITLAFAEKYPDKLSKFGLFHSSAYPDSDEKKVARKKNIDFIPQHGSSKFVEQTTPNLFSDETKNTRPELVKQFTEKYINFNPSSLVHYTRAMMDRKDRVEVLKTFKHPVLFILGEYDTAVPIEQGLKQCTIPEFSYIYICAHSGHMGMLEEPDFCLKALQDFLSGK